VCTAICVTESVSRLGSNACQTNTRLQSLVHHDCFGLDRPVRGAKGDLSQSGGISSFSTSEYTSFVSMFGQNQSGKPHLAFNRESPVCVLNCRTSCKESVERDIF
jgi:hypothetical protein